MSLTAKKVILFLKNHLIYIYICWLLVSFFSFPLSIVGENRPKLKKLFNLNSRRRWRAQYLRYTEYTYYFLIGNCSNTSDFWTKDNLCFISDCRNSFDCKLKSLSEQLIIFYNPSNTLSSSDESVQIKHFKHHTFIGMCSLFAWLNLRILNFC